MNTMNFKEIQRYCNEISKYKITCTCGRKVYVPIDKDFNICSWCGKRVYRNDMIKFKYVLKEKILKKGR